MDFYHSPSETCVELTADQFVGRDDDRLEQQMQDSNVCRRNRTSPSYNDITYSNGRRKTHQIAQIRHLEPQKRQYTPSKVGLHLFWALT